MSQSVTYIHLEPETIPPDIPGLMPSQFIVILEAEVSPEWRSIISNWIINSGCLYMMAWGINCSDWDDSVDMANIAKFKFKDIPIDSFVMTTWHEHESLEEVFRFSKNSGSHLTVRLEQTLIIHISNQNREIELLNAYAMQQDC